jgi:hypothetical protein
MSTERAAMRVLTRRRWADPVTDRWGRRYTEVLPIAIDAVRVVLESYPALECADCSAPIRHGLDRYFDRHTRGGEAVCAACAARLLEVG